MGIASHTTRLLSRDENRVARESSKRGNLISHNCVASGGQGAWNVQGLPPMAQPAPRQSYNVHLRGCQTCALQPWAATPMEPDTRHTDLSVEE